MTNPWIFMGTLLRLLRGDCPLFFRCLASAMSKGALLIPSTLIKMTFKRVTEFIDYSQVCDRNELYDYKTVFANTTHYSSIETTHRDVLEN